MAISIQQFVNGQLPSEVKTFLENQVNPPSFTDLSGTPGAGTGNTMQGKFAVASGATSVTITNSMVGTGSVVVCVKEDADAATIKQVVPAAGSFQVVMSAATAGPTKVRWAIVGPV